MAHTLGHVSWDTDNDITKIIDERGAFRPRKSENSSSGGYK